jgi:hypothetical protein
MTTAWAAAVIVKSLLFLGVFGLMCSQVACVASADQESPQGPLSQEAATTDNGKERDDQDGLTKDDEPSQESIETARGSVADFLQTSPAVVDKDAVLAKYASVQHAGIRTALFEGAILFYDANLARIPNKRWLTIIDFASHSKDQRFFVLDMTGGPMASYPVAHGKSSDPNDDGLATSFSNANGSNQSSVGYYLTAETYIGGNGRSLRIDGLSTTNSNARERLVVIHGSDYVANGRPKQGRSLGCPALPHSVVQGVIDQLQSGSLIYAMN